MTDSSSSSLSFSVSFRGTTHDFSLLPDSTLAELQARLEELTEVPPSLQKILWKGKKVMGNGEDITLVEAGLKNGTKVQMLGSTAKELSGIKAVENENQRIERIMRERALKPSAKVFLALPHQLDF